MTVTNGSWRTLSSSLALVALLAAALLLGAAPAQAQTTIADARDQGTGASVTVDGVVTRAFGDFVRLQDESGPTGASGLVVRQPEGDFFDDVQSGTIRPGTRLTVTGTLSAFNGLLQINEADLSSHSVDGQGAVPAPQNVTLADLQGAAGENYESELVQIEGLTLPDASGRFSIYTTYDATDGTATMGFRVQSPEETAIGGFPIPDDAFTYTGVVGQFNDGGAGADEPDEGYQLIPVRPADVGTTTFFGGRSYALLHEEGGEASATVTVRAAGLDEGETASVTVARGDESTAETGDLSGFAEQELSFSGPDPEPQTISFTVAGDDEEEGIERFEVALQSDDASVNTPQQFTLWLLDDPTSQTSLFADLEGADLRERLREEFASTDDGVVGPPTLDYDVARDTLYGVVFNDGGIVNGFYTGLRATLDSNPDPSQAVGDDGINTEHLWPRSQGAENPPAEGNMHILAPAWEEANAARSNYPYNEIDDSNTDRWFTADGSQGIMQNQAPPESERDAWTEFVGGGFGSGDFDGLIEPREGVEGNAARKSFYFVMAYPDRANGDFFQAQKAALRQWNARDPVDATEQRRNVLIASYQGDELNPFQLDSTLVRRAFFAEEGGGGDVLTIAEARSRLNGTVVTVEGVVTRVEGSNVRIQDPSGPTGASGIVVRDQALADAIAAGDVQRGDRIQATGPLNAFGDQKQLFDENDAEAVSYEVVEEGVGLPDAQSVSVATLAGNGEDYESELVRVENLSIDPGGDDTFVGGGPDGNYTATGPDGNAITLRIPGTSFYADESIPSDAVTFEGVAGQFGTEDPANGYQLQAIAARDLVNFTNETLAVDVSRSFGDPSAQNGYRLVALPGNADRPLAETIDGANGDAWQAYWDDGSGENFFIPWNDSETFDFEAGRGFWLISENAWTVDASLPVLGRDVVNGTVAVPLHDGWNIISNPLAEGLDWSAVEEANGGSLEPLWSFGGSYMQAGTFASATGGRAFYFLNNEGLDELVLPAPSTSGAAVASASASSAPQALTLTTYRAGQRTSAARVGTASGAAEALDTHDDFAPPGRFAAASLRLPVPSSGSSEARQQWLAEERRAPGEDGYAFDLTLRADPGEEPVTLRAGGLGAFDGQAVQLVEPRTGETHDLRTAREVTINPEQEETPLRLLIGSAVEGEAANLPDEVTLRPGYPNPFRENVTVEFDLPEETDVRVAVYDLLGRRVRTLADGRREAGTHTLQWNGRAGSGSALASGVYFVRLKAGDVVRSEKVVRVK